MESFTWIKFANSEFQSLASNSGVWIRNVKIWILFFLGTFSDFCISALVSRLCSFTKTTSRFDWQEWPFFVTVVILGSCLSLCHSWVFVWFLSAFYRADSILLYQLSSDFDKFNCQYPLQCLNPVYWEKHIHHLGVGGEKFPGVGQNDRHHLIIIISGFVMVVKVFSYEWVKLGLL